MCACARANICVCVCVGVGEWMGGWVNGWMNGCMHESMLACLYMIMCKLVHVCMYSYTYVRQLLRNRTQAGSLRSIAFFAERFL
jgi:hypothetical protein